MKERLFSISYTEFNHIGEMTETDQILMKKAIEAVQSSYAPYSAFHVGAAVRLAGGNIYTGSNQENSAYPSGICAERVAIFTASSQHPGETIETVAIAAHTDNFELCDPVTPCGSCRQVMAEYQNLSGKPIRVIMKGMSDRIWMVEGVENLLPLMFHDDKLKK